MFKIWNADRSVKKAVIAETLQQLITKGKAEIQLTQETDVCKVWTE